MGLRGPSEAVTTFVKGVITSSETGWNKGVEQQRAKAHNQSHILIDSRVTTHKSLY